MIFAALVVSGMLDVACTDNTVAPLRDSVPVVVPYVAPEVSTVQGATTIAVHIQPSTTASVVSTTGNAVIPELDGNPDYDAATHTVTLHLVIRNAAKLRLYSPSVSITDTALRILSGIKTSGSANLSVKGPIQIADLNRGTLRMTVNVPDSSPVFLSADSAIRQAYVRPGIQERVQDVVVTLPQGVTAFQVTVTAEGKHIITIQPIAPPRLADSIKIAAERPENLAQEKMKIGRISRNLVFVRFLKSATREQRQIALDAVDGMVVGGGAGMYVVHLPVPPDSLGLGYVLRAIRTLRKVPGVETAIIFGFDPPVVNYRKPVDGVAFQQWILNPDSAAAYNWALETVAAPAAWGCATGSSTTKVAVVDEGFRHEPDLQNNLGSDTVFQTSGPTHGTWVSSVIGAQGNNSLGMTGMLWAAQLGLFDIRTPDPDASSALWYPYYALLHAGLAGYPILNVSWALEWHVQSGRAPSDTSSSDSSLVLENAEALKWVIDSLRAVNIRPLFVLSASNDSVDAFWAGTPAVKLLPGDYSSQVLVVGASRLSTSASTRLAAFSNRGALVDVVAPGENVTVLDGDGSSALDAVNGTSFAVPHVSGLAGLLLSFDPATTTDSLRRFILDGATNGGRFANDPTGQPIPLINAYESLKRSAQRSGAPLCGNRVWVDDAHIHVQRTSTVNESIASVTSAVMVIPHQGGKLIETQDVSSNSTAFAWQPTTRTWTSTTVSSEDGGFFQSSFGNSFAGDTSVMIAVATHDDSAAVPVGVQRVFLHFVNPQTSAGLGDAHMDVPLGALQVCCHNDTIPLATTSTVFVAYPQAGGPLLVAVNRDTTVVAVHDVDQVDDNGHHSIYEYADLSTTAARVDLFQVNVQTFTVDSLKTMTGESVYWLGYGDVGNEIAYATGVLTNYGNTDGDSIPPATTVNCVIHWSNPQFGTDRFSVTSSNACPVDEDRYAGPWIAAGAITPNRLLPHTSIPGLIRKNSLSVGIQQSILLHSLSWIPQRHPTRIFLH